MTARPFLSSRGRVVLALILLVALVLSFLFFIGYYASDDTNYFSAARRWAGYEEGRILGSGQSLIPFRLAYNIPNGIVYWLSGGSLAAMIWWHVVYYLVLIVMVFVLGRLIRDEATGLIAAAVVAASPLCYLFAGAILPDLATAVWLGGSMICLELIRRRSARATPVSNRRLLFSYAAAGALLGVAYSCKETALVMTVPAAIAIIAAAPRLKSIDWVRNGAYLAAGLAAVLLLELLVLRLLSGHSQFRLTIVQDSADLYVLRMKTQGVTPIDRFAYAGAVRLLPFMPISTWLLLAAAAIYPFTRGRNIALVAFFWFPLLYITIGTTNLTAYRPPSLQTRYYVVVLLPAAVMAACVASTGWRRLVGWNRVPGWAKGRAAAAVALAVATLIGLHEANHNLPRAGNFYASPRARGFVVALERARAQYAEYPLVLSKYYKRRMGPLLRETPTEDIEVDPEPPFIFLEALDYLEREGLKLSFRGRFESFDAHTLEVVRPPARRLDAVKRALLRTFGLRPATPMPTSRKGAAIIQLITARGAPHRPARGVAGPPWFGLNDAYISVRGTDRGTLIWWTKSAPFYVQTFDVSGFSKPPTLPAARLEPPRERLTVALEIRAVKGDGAAALIQLYAYSADGEHAHERSKTIELEPGAGPTTVELEVRAEQPLVSYKIRARFVPRSDRVGMVHVSSPRLGEPTPTP